MTVADARTTAALEKVLEALPPGWPDRAPAARHQAELTLIND
jgi:hypothetical protein